MGHNMAQSSLLRSAFGATLLAAACASSPAHALEPKQCLPIAEMNAALKADGQRTLVIGDRLALQDPTGHGEDMYTNRFADAVTANADGSLGYQIEGDKPRQQTSTQMCVSAKLTNVRLFDASQPGTPKAALLGGSFDQGVHELEAKGTRAMLVADTFRGNDTSKIGNALVVFGNVATRNGSMATNTSQGAKMLAVLGDLDYTPEGKRRLNPTLASLDPR